MKVKPFGELLVQSIADKTYQGTAIEKARPDIMGSDDYYGSS